MSEYNYNSAFAWKFDNAFCRAKDRAYLIGLGHDERAVEAWMREEESMSGFGGWGYMETQLEHYFGQFLKRQS